MASLSGFAREEKHAPSKCRRAKRRSRVDRDAGLQMMWNRAAFC
jgi:hypothetical protein